MSMPNRLDLDVNLFNKQMEMLKDSAMFRASNEVDIKAIRFRFHAKNLFKNNWNKTLTNKRKTGNRQKTK